jgi:endonuclease V-like protein UPF0215 family
LTSIIVFCDDPDAIRKGHSLCIRHKKGARVTGQGSCKYEENAKKRIIAGILCDSKVQTMYTAKGCFVNGEDVTEIIEMFHEGYFT